VITAVARAQMVGHVECQNGIVGKAGQPMKQRFEIGMTFKLPLLAPFIDGPNGVPGNGAKYRRADRLLHRALVFTSWNGQPGRT
tara:strand:+ start:17543 stop:17794 length:252 start_codon:yes stop_codon:yes gene_type:complete